MVLTHRVTDNTRTLPVRLVRTIVQLDHGVEHTPLYRFQAVPHIGKRAGSDHTHGVLDIRFFHGLLQIHFLYFVKNCIIHMNRSSPSSTADAPGAQSGSVNT